MWYQIMSACVNVGLAWQDQWMSNRINKKLYNAAAKTAEIKGKMAEANLTRRSAYRNEELGHAVWNLGDNAQTLMGSQRTAMGASGFDISTGDQRILEDTLRRDLEQQKGLNRTAYLQQYEDDLQTRSDILQYNFEAYANRTIAKHYSGINGLAKIIDAGGRAFVNSTSSNLFAGKDKVSSNTWENPGTRKMAGDYMQRYNSSASGQLQPYLNSSTDLSGSLGSYGGLGMKF